MKISVRFKEDVAVMVLSGRFVAGSDGPFLRQKVSELIEAGSRKFIFDFTDVPYIDSTGLGFLAGSRATAEQAGARIVLAGVNEHVKRILDGVKLTSFFELVTGEADGFEKLRKSGGQARPAAGSPRRRSTATPE